MFLHLCPLGQVKLKLTLSSFVSFFGFLEAEWRHVVLVAEMVSFH